MVAYLCVLCHDMADGRRGGLDKDAKRDMWMRAWAKTVAIWFNEGIVQ
jgi:hypothetical protein